MKNNKILALVAILVFGIVGWNSYCFSKTELTQIQMENVEALTQSESNPIFIPCIQSDIQCIVNVMDASGQKGIMTISNSKKVAPYI